MTTLSISAEGQAVALAASSLAMNGSRGSIKPLSAREWHDLSRRIHHADLRPRNLLHMNAQEMHVRVGIDLGLADRLARLLSRGGQLALEVERLASLGIWVLTRADEGYPASIRKRLGAHAPPVLFGAGPTHALTSPGIAVVGSRDVDQEGIEFATELGRLCAEQCLAVFSGGARGVDSAVMDGALRRGGAVVGVTVDSLEKLIRRRDYRVPVAEEQLTLVTPFHPATRWYAGNAMRRNRLIYVLAQAAVIVASSAERGGTRSGALEDLEAGWVPLHVRDDGSPGNMDLIAAGARPLSTRLAQIELKDLIAASATRKAPQHQRPDAGRQAKELASIEEPWRSVELFELAWPLIDRYLEEARSDREVASHFGLGLAQARAWLKRGVREGLAEERSRPRRYASRHVNEQQLNLIEP